MNISSSVHIILKFTMNSSVKKQREVLKTEFYIFKSALKLLRISINLLHEKMRNLHSFSRVYYMQNFDRQFEIYDEKCGHSGEHIHSNQKFTSTSREIHIYVRRSSATLILPGQKFYKLKW
jgi:hypothetical protein